MPTELRKFRTRFWSKVNKTDECWLWTGSLSQGYGQVKNEHGCVERAHRVAYRLEVGPLIPGLELSHLCHVRACVRPDHLDQTTHLKNVWATHYGS